MATVTDQRPTARGARSRLLAAFVFGLVVVALTAGCGDDDTDVPGDEIVIGTHAILSGDYAVFGIIPAAIEAWFDRVNAAGGVHGRSIRYVTCDSQFDTTEALRCAQRLVEEDGAFALLNNQSFAAHTAAYAYLDEEGVPDILIASGAQALRDDLHEFAIPGVVSYYEEARHVAEYLNTTHPGASAGVIYLQDLDGESYRDGFRAGFEGEIVAEEGIAFVDQDLAAPVDTMIANGAQIVVLAVAPPHSGLAINALRGVRGSDAQIVLSSVNLVPFVLLTAGDPNLVDGALIPVTIVEACQDSPAVTAHREFAEGAGLEPSYFTIYGQVIAELFVAILEEAGEELTREGLIEAAANVRDLRLDLAVGPISMSDEDREPFETYQLSRVVVDPETEVGCIVPEGAPTTFESTID